MGFIERLKQQREQQFLRGEKERLKRNIIAKEAISTQFQRSNEEKLRESLIKEAQPPTKLEQSVRENDPLYKKSKQFMYASAFPEMLQELHNLEGYVDVKELSSDSQSLAEECLRRVIGFSGSHFYLMLRWPQTLEEREAISFNNPLSRELPSYNYVYSEDGKYVVVESAPEGHIIIHKGGFLQSPFNGNNESTITVTNSTWNHSRSIQEKALEKAFRNPLRIRAKNRYRKTPEYHERTPHEN